MIVGTLGTIPKGLERRPEELQIRERIGTTALLKSARILTRVLQTRGDLLSLRLQ